MTEFKFESSRDVKLRVDGEVLGAVSRVVCESEKSVDDICEFLSDVPVFRASRTSYKITLDMVLGEDNPFVDRDSFDCIELEGRSRTVRYCGCTVLSTKSTVSAEGFVRLEACIGAESREVDE